MLTPCTEELVLPQSLQIRIPEYRVYWHGGGNGLTSDVGSNRLEPLARIERDRMGVVVANPEHQAGEPLGPRPLDYGIDQRAAHAPTTNLRRRPHREQHGVAVVSVWARRAGSPRLPNCEYGIKVLPSGMAKEKVTLTLDAENLAGLRALVGVKSLSASVDSAVAAHLARLQHLAAVDEWLAELEQKRGPIPPETLDWAARIVDRWAAPPKRRRKAG